MRFLTLGLAVAFTVAAASWAQACPAMKNASTQGEVAANDQAPQSTPAKIPVPAKTRG